MFGGEEASARKIVYIKLHLKLVHYPKSCSNQVPLLEGSKLIWAQVHLVNIFLGYLQKFISIQTVLVFARLLQKKDANGSVIGWELRKICFLKL